MDFNSSLDDIIKSKSRPRSRDRHPYRVSSSSRYLSPALTYVPYPNPAHQFHSQRGQFVPTQRIPPSNTIQRPLRGTQDLRERIGRRSRPTSGGLSTADLPNRQRMRHDHYGSDPGNDNNDIKRAGHSIVITKPVHRKDSPSLSGNLSGRRKSDQVDPTSIVITKAVKKQPSSSSPSTKASQPLSTDHQKTREPAPISPPSPRNGKVDLDIGEQRQEQDQIRQQMEQQLKDQLRAQNEQILELQQLLSNHRMAADLTANRQFGRPLSSHSNTVLLSNLDPMTTSSDIEVVCGGFGIVVRCDVSRDTQGRSCGEAEVEFLDHESALNCIAKFDNELVDERVIRATLRPHPLQHTMRSVIAPTRSGYRTTSQVLYTDKHSSR